jgi:hypothetical protein
VTELDLPPTLRDRVRLATAERWMQIQGAFKLERERLVWDLRKAGMSDPAIGKLLGVTQQYLNKAYPRTRAQKRSGT